MLQTSASKEIDVICDVSPMSDTSDLEAQIASWHALAIKAEQERDERTKELAKAKDELKQTVREAVKAGQDLELAKAREVVQAAAKTNAKKKKTVSADKEDLEVNKAGKKESSCNKSKGKTYFV